MRSPRFLYISFYLLIILGCKEDNKSTGATSNNLISEVTQLTDAGNLDDFFEDNSEEQEIEIYNLQKVSEFYKGRNFEPVWNNKELREDLFRNIENIEEEGLFFEDYHGEKIKDLLNSLDTNTEEENNLLEILLTDTFLRLSEDLATGKLNPKEIYEIWGTPLNEVNSIELLNSAISNKNISKALNSQKPDHIIYKGLKKALADYKRADWRNTKATRIPEGKLIRPGEDDVRMLSITKRLSELGYYSQPVDSANINYNKDIQEALKNFQKDHDLQIDGLLGNTTVKNLNYTKEDRLHQILVNLERWRWYPRDLGEHYIIINIPDYKLSVVKNGDTIRTHKTMVGTRYRKTPIFSDEIDYIIYNPTWTIPPTIKKRDVIPGALRDKEYLNKKNIEVFDRNGNLVDPATIDWSGNEPKSYTYVQPAGATNPLGTVKIIYPNKYMIYLHDTPSKNLFENNARAQSSGCVRVEDAQSLARYLLNDQDIYDDEKIAEILSSGKTTEIPVKQKVKVHHFYWTAYQKKDTTKFIDDIYDLDQELWTLFSSGN